MQIPNPVNFKYKYSSIRSQNAMCSGSTELQFSYRHFHALQRNVSMAAEWGAVRPSMSSLKLKTPLLTKYVDY